MSETIEAKNLPENEKVYLKKDWLGWRVVVPGKNEDGSYNWFNILLGGKRGVYIMLFYILLAGLFYLGIKELIGNYALIANNPCNFCKTCQDYVVQAINSIHFDNAIPNLNMTNFTILK